MAPLRRPSTWTGRIQRKASGALPSSSDYPSESQADQRSVTSHPFRRRHRKRCRVEFLPSSGLFLASTPEKALCGWAKQGKAGARTWGASSEDNRLGEVVCAPILGLGTCSVCSAHSRNGVYFLMALALSHEAGTLSFKGTESSLLPHLAGSLNLALSFEGITARQQPQACGLEALQ